MFYRTLLPKEILWGSSIKKNLAFRKFGKWGKIQLNIFPLYRTSPSVSLNTSTLPAWPWTHPCCPVQVFLRFPLAPNFSHNRNCVEKHGSARTVYPLTGTKPLWANTHGYQPVWISSTFTRKSTQNTVLPGLACLHSVLLHPCNPRAGSWHVSCNSQIQYSGGIQRIQTFKQSFLQLRFEHAHGFPAHRVSPKYLKPIASWCLQSPHFSSDLCQNKSALLYSKDFAYSQCGKQLHSLIQALASFLLNTFLLVTTTEIVEFEGCLCV